MRIHLRHSVILLAILLTGCTSAYYKTMRTLGKEKRDILISRVRDAKKDQDQTKEKLKTTMESFQALTGFEGGSLESSYKRLNGDYESANDQAQKLHDKVNSIDQVSKDLFSEWQGEIGQMGNQKLKSQSTAMLRSARPPTCAPCARPSRRSPPSSPPSTTRSSSSNTTSTPAPSARSKAPPPPSRATSPI